LEKLTIFGWAGNVGHACLALTGQERSI